MSFNIGGDSAAVLMGREHGKGRARTAVASRSLALAVLLLGSGCGSSVPLSDKPQDQSSAQALAKTVAKQADCPDFESYDTNGKDQWDFTCQKSGVLFLVRTASNTKSRDDAVRTLVADGVSYKTGEFFMVWPFQDAERKSRPADLERFPGALTTPQLPRETR